VGRTAPRWLLALGLLGSLTAQAASPVWAVRGTHNTVYLAGSIHLLPAGDAVLPPGFDRSYADSARLVMEMDLGKFDPMEAMSWMMDHGTLPAGTNLRGVLGEQRYGRVSAAATGLGLPMSALDSLAPWVVGIEITDLAYEHEGYDPEQGVEEQLVRRAENLKSDMRDVTSAWRRGDAARLAALLSSEYNSFPSLYKPLVTDRNRRWLPQLEELLRANDNSLVVVGALHLVGQEGLLDLLRKKGYQIRQLD